MYQFFKARLYASEQICNLIINCRCSLSLKGETFRKLDTISVPFLLKSFQITGEYLSVTTNSVGRQSSAIKKLIKMSSAHANPLGCLGWRIRSILCNRGMPFPEPDNDATRRSKSRTVAVFADSARRWISVISSELSPRPNTFCIASPPSTHWLLSVTSD